MTPLLSALAAALGALSFAITLPANEPATPLQQPTAKPTPTQAPTASPAPTQAPSASAPAAVPAIAGEIIVLHGTKDGTGIDPKIGNIPALSKPPMSSFNGIKLLSRTNTKLDLSKTVPLKLPSGDELQLVYKEAKPGAAPRFVISMSVQSAAGKVVVPKVEYNAKPGDWFFLVLGGQTYQGGSLAIGMKVQ
jgi:hypothetical protein